MRLNTGAAGDKVKYLQAFDALSDLQKQGKYDDRAKLLSNDKNINQVRSLLTQDVFKGSDVGKRLRDSDI
jgi:hypothetical protein